MSATGNFVDAATALAWGLVNHVVPHEELPARSPGSWPPTSPAKTAGAVRQIYATYAEGSLRAPAPGGGTVESRVAGAWQGGGIDPAEIEANRQAVVARGRTQV